MNSINKFGSMLLTLMLPLSVVASQQSHRTKHEERWTGTLISVNAQDKTLTAERWNLTHTFHLGDQCAISTVDDRHAALADLRPGETVRIRYRDVQGVRVVDRVTEKPLHYRGTVQSFDPTTRTLTMAEAAFFRPFREPDQFQLASDCKVTLWNGDDGKLTDIHPGDRIFMVYEVPNRSQVAYRIHERTTSCQGVADAVDLPARTLAVKGKFGEKQFALGDDCRIILSGDKNGHLKDVVPGQRYRFTYEDVNGINVLDQITPVPPAKSAQTAALR